MRYRFSLTSDGDPMSGEETLTIDAARARAAELRKKIGGPLVYVREFVGGQSRLRGRVDERGWHWLSPCPKCKGTGEVGKQPCTRCVGQKVVEDIDHG